MVGMVKSQHLTDKRPFFLTGLAPRNQDIPASPALNYQEKRKACPRIPPPANPAAANNVVSAGNDQGERK